MKDFIEVVPVHWIATALLLTGCAGVGPGTVARDRFDYVISISESWKQQMLLNLLKVRYSDAPVFRDVASVINAYELTGDVSLSGDYAPIGRCDTFGHVGAAGRTDRDRSSQVR